MLPLLIDHQGAVVWFFITHNAEGSAELVQVLGKVLALGSAEEWAGDVGEGKKTSPPPRPVAGLSRDGG